MVRSTLGPAVHMCKMCIAGQRVSLIITSPGPSFLKIIVLSCKEATLQEGVFIGRSVHLSVGPSICLSIHP